MSYKLLGLALAAIGGAALAEPAFAQANEQFVAHVEGFKGSRVRGLGREPLNPCTLGPFFDHSYRITSTGARRAAWRAG